MAERPAAGLSHPPLAEVAGGTGPRNTGDRRASSEAPRRSSLGRARPGREGSAPQDEDVGGSLPAGPRGLTSARVLLYATLLAFAAFSLAPMVVVALNSFRSFEEITRSSVIGWPEGLRSENWRLAWDGYCIAGNCVGIRPYMWNSLLLVVPATLISTLLGALNGYALSLWRFRGADLVFATITLGVFLPAQMKLVPWALTLRELGLSSSMTGLILIHVVQGMSFTTLFCRNYYVSVPPDLIKAARIDGAGFFRILWRIVLPLSPPILIVTVIWQFTNIWNEYLYGVTFSEGTGQPVTAALMALSANIAQAREYGVESAAVLLAALPTLIVYLVGGRWFVRGLTVGAVK